ncbi:MAG: 16S rRNA (guanine(966)-N(2))-methyltransferase RsmD [Pelagibacteraceae bacterium TMED267]|nr:MAG: 16S rRNA (guanine(966)-N(2))-methyltransferase RsmD [Pelagibacteraceae bacterium TMED267]|tara:strand:- start:3759 stop:4325 length:567 start_codon:yes stop_codon:yes gene_type:complete
MRVIAGFFKGKKILEPKDANTRPLKDLTKESIFNIIQHSNKFEIDLKKSNILDLFSGVGSFGIECLSRGAKNVIFVENYNKVLRILRKNLINLKTVENYQIIESDINKTNIFSILNKKFNIIFLDPPYKDKNLENLLNDIYKSKILFKKSVVIIHRHKNEKDDFPKQYKIIDEKKYGISKIIFLSILD